MGTLSTRVPPTKIQPPTFPTTPMPKNSTSIAAHIVKPPNSIATAAVLSSSQACRPLLHLPRPKTSAVYPQLCETLLPLPVRQAPSTKRSDSHINTSLTTSRIWPKQSIAPTRAAELMVFATMTMNRKRRPRIRSGPIQAVVPVPLLESNKRIRTPRTSMRRLLLITNLHRHQQLPL